MNSTVLRVVTLCISEDRRFGLTSPQSSGSKNKSSYKPASGSAFRLFQVGSCLTRPWRWRRYITGLRRDCRKTFLNCMTSSIARICSPLNFVANLIQICRRQLIKRWKIKPRPPTRTNSRHQTFHCALVLYVVSCTFFVLTGEPLTFVMQTCSLYFLGHPQAVSLPVSTVQ
jgi:hypothetical protein